MKVFVYYNLHRKCWSVKALEGPSKGRVIKHCKELNLVNCTFKVSEAGRQRVLREKVKNVHAGVVGQLTTTSSRSRATTSVNYNPYKYRTFVDEELYPIHTAKTVCMLIKNNKGVVLATK